MPDLPPEVWYYVALFLPDKTLRKCLSVNRTFFDICMRIRYQTVCICRWDKKEMRNWNGYGAEPFVRKHIHKLSLVIPPDIPSKSKGSLLLTHHSKSKLPFFKANAHPVSRSDFMSSLLKTIQLLHQVETVQICMAREKYTDANDMGPFFSAMWESVGPRLRTLRLRGTIHTLPYMIPSSHYFSNVDEFDLHIVARSTDVLLVFPGTSNDLSSIFRYMPTCSLLERLSIRCMAPSFREADQLQRFLTEHGSNLTFFGLSLTIWDFQADMMSRFLPESVADGKSLQKITVLDLEPYPFNMINFLEAARNIMRCCHDTLEVLSLAQHVKVEEISLQVLDPDIRLFDELASRLPNLRQLTLHMHTYHNRSHLALALRNLKAQLKSRSYTNWKLEDISIYYSMVQWKDYHMALHVSHHVMLSGFLRLPI
ncbi:hypothetical protein BDQ17DRAFT_1358546 [Cyathus striatus]|nr:hypothetical protein BDQ17DRAFT_1358546 [Cyathus striatus]